MLGMKKSTFVGVSLLLVGLLSSCGANLPGTSLGSGSVAGSSSGGASSSQGGSVSEGTTSQGSTTESTSSDASVSSDLSSSTTSYPAIDYIKVFCETSWSYVYTWIESPKSEPQGSWPGTPLENYNERWKTYELKGYTAINLIFNKGKGSAQTDDLSIASAGYWWYYNSQWYQSEPEISPTSSSNSSTSSSSTSSTSIPTTSVSLPTYDNGDEVILHCFDWSCDTIRSKLDAIKAAGYTAIQTSPMQQCKDYDASYTNTSGQWWKLYQPVSFSVAKQTWVGNAASFKSLTNAAHEKGLKIIVDIVANHMAGDKSYLSDQVGQYEATIANNYSTYFHNYFAYDSGNESTYVVTQGSIGMPDLNTGNDYVQSRVLSYLKELVDDGADGFRFDAAKHIELPSDGNYASQFWVNTLAATRTYATTTYSRSLFAYGEILNSAGNSRHYSDYVPYFNALTDNQTGNNMLSAVQNNNTGDMAKSYYASGLQGKNTVLWGESHDTYMNSDGSSKNSSQANVDKAYCLVTARKEASSLYFVRPGSTMNSIQSDNYLSTPIAAANLFHRTFASGSESYQSGSNCAAVVRNNGSVSGALIVTTNSTNFSITLSSLPDGSYKDQVSGNAFSVSNHQVSGSAASSGVVVLLQA
jgi:hypothetical protein